VEVREAEMRSADGLRLFYRVWREPAVPAPRLVVLLHGFADHSGRYGPLVEHLCGRQAVVYGLDQRGNGRSEGARGHVMDYREFVRDLDDFSDLARKSEPGLECTLYAHSTAGIFALHYMLAHPETFTRCVLSAPALILAVKAPAWKTAIGRALAGPLPTLALKAGFSADVLSRDPEAVRANVEDPLVTQAITTRMYRETYLRAAPEALARIEALKVPFLYVQGGDDQLVSTEVAREFERRAHVAHRVIVYPDARHEVHNDINREQLFSDVDAWLEAS